MRPERSNWVNSSDVVSAADEVAECSAGYGKGRFTSERILRRAVPQLVTTIGEAANHISSELRSAYPDVGWSDARAFRNVAVHRYFAIDWSIVWRTGSVSVPEFRRRATDFLAAELPEGEP